MLNGITKHKYFCEVNESDRKTEYESWKDFKKQEGLNYDFDYNLLFRFDLKQDYDENNNKIGNVLQLHHVLQRHGTEIWHAVIHNITSEDLKEINNFLMKAWKNMEKLWKEVNESEKRMTKNNKELKPKKNKRLER